ncbi:MAG: phospholipid phosphatase [Blastococcus sp.]|jgi:membrane-associated phospholipid phosphatase|nr:phospholipid phosphatase [Blastococcus sp.]
MTDRRHVAWRDFLVTRFRPGTPLGLVLTVNMALLLLLLSAFSVVTEDVVAGEELVAADGPIERFLIDRRTPALTMLMRICTQLGSAPVVVPLVVGVALLGHRRHGSWRPLGFLAFAVGGATLTSTVIKLVVARPRPESGALVHALGYAFPSGHSTTAAAAWLSTAVVLASLTPRRAWRAGLGVVAIAVVLLVGVSRVYLGVHAPTDVLGGWALGALWVAGGLIGGRVLFRDDPATRPTDRAHAD